MNDSKNKNIAKISNDMLESYIQNTNLTALKILMYIAKSDKVDIDLVHTLRDEQIIETTISVKDLLSYTTMDIKTLERNIKKLNETSISFGDKKGKGYMNLLPYAKFGFKGFIDVQIYSAILKLTHSLTAYSLIDVSTLVALKSPHSVRMLMILERIKNFSVNVSKRKEYTLDVLNNMFDTNYKNIPEFQRRVLEVAKNELDEKSKITFIYETKKDKLLRNVGRAKVVSLTIDLVVRNDYQPSLF